MAETKPIWQMDASERVVEQSRRISVLADFFAERGGKVAIKSQSLNVETDKNNYCFDVAIFDPRFLKVEIFYEIESWDLNLATWACYNAMTKIHVAKAKAVPMNNGYRLSFFTETLADSIEDFLKVALLHVAVVEDCREAYLKIYHRALDAEEESWSTRPVE